MSVKALVFDVTRGSFHDGPGVRTAIYLKGCSLSCVWCHNPEGQNGKPQLGFSPVKCIGCGSCVSACPHKNITVEAGELKIRYAECVACGLCANVCPVNAFTIYGKWVTAEEVMSLIRRDKIYFRDTGGVTFSGGECLLYPDFMAEVLTLCVEENIGTIIETALCVPEKHVCKVVPLANEIYADVKHMDSAEHRRLTGCGNERILQNIGVIASLNVPFTVRTPLIPTLNDSYENLCATARFALKFGAAKYVLLPYNPLCTGKYKPIGRDSLMKEFETQSADVLTALCDRLNCALNVKDFVVFQK